MTPAAGASPSAELAISPAPWRYVGASARGTSHEATGAPCQDASRTIVVPTSRGEILVAVCADGAGSAPRSHEGAELACGALLGEVRDYLEAGRSLARLLPPAVEEWFIRVNAALHDLAAEHEAPARDFACTLLLAAVEPGAAVFAQIGDGAIVTSDGENDYRPVFWPESGEYANMTFFVTEPEAIRHLQVAIVLDQGVDEVALFTDGIQSLALRYETRGAHAPFFRPMFARLRDEAPGDAEVLSVGLRAFLESPKVNERTDDDKTLVLATRRAPAVVSRVVATAAPTTGPAPA